MKKFFKILFKTFKWIFWIVIAAFLIAIFVDLFESNSGQSKSKGTVANGSIENAYQLNFINKNFNYFSPISYYFMNNAFVHNRLHKVVTETYKRCEKELPNHTFQIMECGNKKGGKMNLHRTHQNGLSIDFMVPKIKNGKQTKLYDWLGLWHYLLDFDDDGKMLKDKNTSIDFETMARHILILEEQCKANNMKIEKVIFKLELKDDLFATLSGKKLKTKNIYFAKSLPKQINDFHDDHYHIDFAIMK